MLQAKANAMSESEYKRQREEIDSTYPKGGKGKKVNINALRDQALAKLAHRSGWTQERLAEVEEVTRQAIAYRLRFGRFLDFATTGCNSENPSNLWLHDITERKFRGFWEQTEKGTDERFRFRDVRKLIEEHTFVRVTLPTGTDSKAVVKEFGDGKWHSIETMAKHLGLSTENEEQMKAFRQRLREAVYRRHGGHLWESRKYGSTVQYRILKASKKKVDMAILETEIAPILQKLEAEGKKNMATMSPPTVAHLTFQLKEALKKIAQ